MSRKRRVLVLMHEDLVPPESIEGLSDKEIAPFKTEYDVVVTLEEIGHEVKPLGVGSDLGVIRRAIHDFRPHICFNLLEEFHGVAVYDHHVVSYLELMKRRYTGCNPRGLLLGHDKALSKKILAYHRIPCPEFLVLPMARKVRRPKRLQFPLLVKSLTEEGSVGISKASLCNDDEQLQERAAFIHRQLGTDAIAEQFIPGREMYVGVMGNQRLETFPTWELLMTNKPADEPMIATAKVKWDEDYQKKIGVKTKAAELDPALDQKIKHLCKRAYRALNLTGYARMDLRINDKDEIFLIEANPNPQLAYGEDFAESAELTGLRYGDLLQRILNLGLSYRAQWQG
ncbi:D-alanine--D-alanine ligase [Acidobacteria bacterium Mor1]|nr:D-alanine--D-alanine ligase [Acidobacteria bacterium Mor1]